MFKIDNDFCSPEEGQYYCIVEILNLRLKADDKEK